MFQRAYGSLDNNHIVDSVITNTNAIAGSKFTIEVNEHGVPLMSWMVKKYNLYKPSHPPDVFQFCCDEVLPNIKSNQINGFT